MKQGNLSYLNDLKKLRKAVCVRIYSIIFKFGKILQKILYTNKLKAHQIKIHRTKKGGVDNLENKHGVSVS